MTDDEVDLMISALKDIVLNIEEYKKDYVYENRTNVFWHKKDEKGDEKLMAEWFSLG